MLQIEKEFDFFKKINHRKENKMVLFSIIIAYLTLVFGSVNFLGIEFIIGVIFHLPEFVVKYLLNQFAQVIDIKDFLHNCWVTFQQYPAGYW